MFTISTLKTALAGAIGLKDTDNPDLPTCTLTDTDTGMYYDDYHPMITFENLYYIAPNYDGMSFDTWAATAYTSGDIVKYDNIAYEATRDIAATSTAPTVLTAWESPVNPWIEGKINASINKLFSYVQTNKKLAQTTKTFLSNIQLVDGAGRMDDTIDADSRFVGFEITPKYTNNISAVIDYIGLQFTAAQTDLTLYLFHSSQNSAIATWSLSTTVSNSFDWLSATSPATGVNSMPYVDYARNIDAGGSYYLGYFEDDISGSAIEKDFTSCYKSVKYNAINKWLTIRPIAVSELNGTNIFDIDDIGYTDSNFGLNLSISVKTDVTEMMTANKGLFTEALGYQFSADMLDEMLHNPASRINRNQENATRNKILYELTEDQNGNSLYKKVKNIMAALDFDLSSISQVLPRLRKGMRKTWM